jgi:acyl-CoA thioester hydrolase
MTSGPSNLAEPDSQSPPIPGSLQKFECGYAETDQMGMVYYANYLVWFEVGRAEFCRQRGFAYRDFERENDAYLAVAEAQCRYHTPARYDDVC